LTRWKVSEIGIPAMDKERIGIVAAARLARLASSKRSMTMSCWRRCASVSMRWL
jgi:hypothetical protein